MRRFIALLFLLPTLALGADAVLTWTNPTTNTDGSSIPASGAGALTGTRVEWGTCNGTAFGTVVGQQAFGVVTTATVPGFAAGTTHCFRVYDRNSYGNESAASNVATKTFPTPTPNPPTLNATITVAYELNGIKNDGTVLLGRAVGQIDLGAPCLDYKFETNKGVYYGIDRAYVRLTREPKSPIVVTKCEAA